MSIVSMGDDYIQAPSDGTVGEWDIDALREHLRLEVWNRFEPAQRGADGRLIRPKKIERSRVVISDYDRPVTRAIDFDFENGYRHRKLVCKYCDCISSKESGTCEHCGAPLVYEE